MVAPGGRGRGGPVRAARSRSGTRWCLQPLGPGAHFRLDSQNGTAAGGAGVGRDARPGRPAHLAGRGASASRRCGAAPRLLSAPDVPIPFAPELEACCLPDARRIAAVIGRTAWKKHPMDEPLFRMPLFLPAQGAAETEATIIEWCIAEGDHFQRRRGAGPDRQRQVGLRFRGPLRRPGVRGSFTWKAKPCRLSRAGAGDRDHRSGDAGMDSAGGRRPERRSSAKTASPAPASRRAVARSVVILGVGGYLPPRVVTNAELVQSFPEISDQYIYQVTGIRQPPLGGRRRAALRHGLQGRRWRPSASRESPPATSTPIIVATTTPDVAMPSTACILQDRLSLPNVPAFDLNAACCGWLYAVAMARGMILSGLARNVLTVGVEMQSRLLDPTDRNAYFLFGDGAGAAIISAGTTGHRIRHVMLGGDSRGHAHGPPRRARLCHSQRQRRWPRQRRGDFRPLDSHRRPRPVPLCHGEFRRHHSPRDRPDRLDAGRDPLGHSAPGQRPDSEAQRPSAAECISTASS